MTIEGVPLFLALGQRRVELHHRRRARHRRRASRQMTPGTDPKEGGVQAGVVAVASQPTSVASDQALPLEGEGAGAGRDRGRGEARVRKAGPREQTRTQAGIRARRSRAS